MKRLFPILMMAVLLCTVIATFLPTSVFAVTAPDIADTLNETNVTADSMRLNGTLSATGGENPHVYICWAETGQHPATGSGSIERYGDFDEWLSYWENVEDLGTLGAGAFFADITGLMPGTVQWMAAAINSADFDYSTDVTGAATAVPSTLKQSYETTNWNKGITSVNGIVERFGQTFTATSDYTIASISIYKGSNARGDLSLALYDVDGSHKPTGAAKATATTIPQASVSTNSWNRFYFTVPCAITNGTEYAFALWSTNDSGYADSVLLDYDTGCYAGGFLWKTTNSGSTWFDYAASEGKTETDLDFRLYSTDSRRARLRTSYLEETDMTETTATLTGILENLYVTTCNVTFQWGTTTAYGTETAVQAETVAPTGVTQGITGLTAKTEYHFRIKSVDTNGTSYGADVKFLTPDYSLEGSTVYDFGTYKTTAAGVANQRKSFYGNGRYWVFFHNESGNLKFTSSVDGTAWEAAADCGVGFTNYDAQVCVAYSEIEQRVHYVTGRTDYKLGYRSGTPNADGTITWDYAFSECIGTALATRRYTAPSIALDVNGYPWVLVGSCVVGDLATKIFHSSTKNGIWTETAGFPKTPAFGLGTEDDMWQRGISVPLANGDMYFVSAKRSSVGFWSYDYTAPLRGVYVNATTHAVSAVETCTTSDMDVVGDVAGGAFASFSACSYNNDVYLSFCTTSNDIVVVKRTYSTGLWGAETTLASGVWRRTAPVISVNESGELFVFWAGGVDGTDIYYRSKTLTGSWQVAVDWKFQNCLNDVSDINAWLDSVEGKVGLLYRSSTYTEQGYRHEPPNSPNNTKDDYLKFALLNTGFAIGTRAATSIYGDSASLNAEIVDDNGEDCSVRFQYGLTTSMGSATGWSGSYGTGDNVSQIVLSLVPNTTYYFKAQAYHASDGEIVNGSIRIFTTSTGEPTVTTIAAKSIGVSSATLRGYLSYDTGVSCTYRFQYGLTAAYGTDTTWSTSTILKGTTFNTTITGLTPGETYHFRAQCTNAYGVGSGSDMTFTMYLVSNPPTALFAIPVSGTEISLSWVSHTGSPQTVIRYLTTGYPTTIATGTLGYLGELSSCVVDNLTPGTTYYFSAWGYDSPTYYSATYDTAVATTYATSADDDYVPPGDTTDVSPDPTGFAGMPGYAESAWLAGIFHMDHGIYLRFAFMAVGAIVIIGIGALSESLIITLLATIVVCAVLFSIGLIPWFLMLAYVVCGLGVTYAKEGR
jgi:hypothetical protein